MRRLLIAIKEKSEVLPLTHLAAGVGGALSARVIDVIRPYARPGWGQELVAGAVGELAAMGVLADGMVVTPARSLSAQIVFEAAAANVDAIVLGNRGRGRLESMLGESISHSVLASTNLPLLAVPDGANIAGRARRILVAIRSEAEITCVFGGAAEVPGRQARLRAVHALGSVAIQSGSPPNPNPQELSTPTTAAAWAWMRERGVTGSVLSLPRGQRLPDAIASAAALWPPDLIVVGCRRPARGSAFLSGSTGYRLLGLTRVPLLFVRTPAVVSEIAAEQEAVPSWGGAGT